MERAIDTLILDLGGVLIDVDYEASAEAFRKLGFPDFEGLYSKARQNHVFDRFETGELSPAGFRDAVRELLDPDLDDHMIDRCWNAMLGSIPQDRLELVSELRRRMPVLLLSNTNAIHVPAFEEIILRENGVERFKDLFDGAYYSCELGMRKPDPDIFMHVLTEHGADAERTLFIDDSIQHVEGAQKVGLMAEHLDLGSEDIVKLVQRLGLLA